MSLTDIQSNIVDNLITRFEKSGPQLVPGIQDLREGALTSLKETGLPGNKHEEYKYFNVSRKISRDYSFTLVDAANPDEHWIKSSLVDDEQGIHLVFLNGLFRSDLSRKGNSLEGMEFYRLDETHPRMDDILRIFKEEQQNINRDPYLELNHAFFNSGYLLNINHKKDAQPIYIYHFSENASENVMINSKGIIVVESDTKADITEIYLSKDKTHQFRNHNTEVYARNGALVNYQIVQETGHESVCINNFNIHQSESSRVNVYTFALSGKHLRNNLNVLLNQEHLESHLYGLYFVSGSDHIDNHTTVDHKKPHCFSNEYYKGIIDDSGMGTFNGKIYVRPNAQKTNAFQSNKNLVLTDAATINTKPQLEIWADDVKCSHGATTGQIDEEQLFYLRSRGLDKDSATALLLHAFAFDIVDKVESVQLRKYIGAKINQRLGYQFSD